MNIRQFETAAQLYDAKDYAGAYRAYAECLSDQSAPLMNGEPGLVYHRMGNCLVKTGDYNGAIAAYSNALKDTAYDAAGSVYYNLGMAYASMRDYDSAVAQFQNAVQDAKYATPHKAHLAMGNALMKSGKTAEAGVAFREAALDTSNPDPTKALLNLGVCFMALDRPNDAVVSYESALQFDMDKKTRNKLCANLGQAYVASGQMKKAVSAFEAAIADKSYFLSDSASVDYQRAVAAVAQGTDSIPIAVAGAALASGGAAAAAAAAAGDTSGFDVMNGEVYGNDVIDMQYGGENNTAVIPANYQPQEDSAFFTATDEEIEAWSKGDESEGKKKHKGLKVFLIIFVILLVLLGVGAFAYSQGYGFPTQESQTRTMFENPTESDKVFASTVSETKKDSLKALLVKDANITILGSNQSMLDSEMFVTAQTPEGGTVQYCVTFSRDLVGWKVSDVELYFTSQNS